MTLSNNARIIQAELIKLGYQPHQTAGLLGRLMQESGPSIDTKIGGDRDASGNPTSFGAAQWRGDRLTNLKNFASNNGGSWDDPAIQARFIHHELTGSESRAGDMLRGAKTVEDATKAAMAFERPRGFTWDDPTAGHGWQNSLTNAQRVAGLLSGNPVQRVGPESERVDSAPLGPIGGSTPAAPPAPVGDPMQASKDKSWELGMGMLQKTLAPAAAPAPVFQPPNMIQDPDEAARRQIAATMMAGLMKKPRGLLGMV